MASWRLALLGGGAAAILSVASTASARDRAPGEGKDGDPSWNKYMEQHGAIEEGLPPWMTKGEEIRLAVVDELIGQGNTGGALEILAQMRVEGLDGPEVDLRQGIALRMEGVTSEAERILQLAQKRMRGDPRPASELCILYADLQRLEDAIDQCRAATRGSDADASAWNNLGFLQLSAGHPEEALEAAETAVRLDGSEPRFRNNLGLIQATLGRESDAFRTLGSTMPHADAAYMVGLTIERRDGPEAARSWFDRALKLDPAHPPTLEHLGLAAPDGESGDGADLNPRSGSQPGNPEPGTEPGESPGGRAEGSEAP